MKKPANPVTPKRGILCTIPTVGIPVPTDSKRACHTPILLRNCALLIQLASDLAISSQHLPISSQPLLTPLTTIPHILGFFLVHHDRLFLKNVKIPFKIQNLVINNSHHKFVGMRIIFNNFVLNSYEQCDMIIVYYRNTQNWLH